jgi:hypothetical protein
MQTFEVAPDRDAAKQGALAAKSGFSVAAQRSRGTGEGISAATPAGFTAIPEKFAAL